MTSKEWFNVIKIQNKIDISLEQVLRKKCVSFLDMNHNKIMLKIRRICEHLPRSKSDKIKINDFVNLPILSEEAFKAIDRC